MKLVAVCACTSGIAHTYMAKEKLRKAAESLGHEIHIETQGTIGVEDELTPVQIAEADAVILAVDIHVEKGPSRASASWRCPRASCSRRPSRLSRRLKRA